MTCDSTLNSGIALTIDPGVMVKFDSGVKLTIQGTLDASGTEGQPITFTSNQTTPAAGDWDVLKFEAGSSNSDLTWCVIEYATTGVFVYAGPGISNLNPSFTDCTIRNNSIDGIRVAGYVRKVEVPVSSMYVVNIPYKLRYYDKNAICPRHLSP